MEVNEFELMNMEETIDRQKSHFVSAELFSLTFMGVAQRGHLYSDGGGSTQESRDSFRLSVEAVSRISIITATFKTVEQLPHTFRSLRERAYRGYEWPVVDRGSKDRVKD